MIKSGTNAKFRLNLAATDSKRSMCIICENFFLEFHSLYRFAEKMSRNQGCVFYTNIYSICINY